MLADPVAFRDQIGGVKARLQEQYEREAFQTPEYEYDFYYEDEAHSLAKSTVKKIELPSNSHIFFNSPTPATTPCKMALLCENGADEDEKEENSIIKSSVKMTSYDVEMIEIEPMECETINLLVSDISEGNALPICPTTPSRACFESAFSALKSVKKSPFQASASKKKVQTPPVQLISSNFTFDVESDDRINSISADIFEIVDTLTLANTANLEADIIDNVGSFFDIPAEDLIVLDKGIIPVTVDTAVLSFVPEAIMTVNNHFWWI